MSKISNAFLMIKLLSNGRVYSVKELSMELGVTERMVRYYKEQLEMAGYIIESFKGPGGGYYINKNNIMNIDYFNKYDLEILDRIEKEITCCEFFLRPGKKRIVEIRFVYFRPWKLRNKNISSSKYFHWMPNHLLMLKSEAPFTILFSKNMDKS